MKPLSGPSEAHRTKNATFKQSYRPIVVAGQQSAGDPQFIPHDLLHITHRELNLKTWSSGTSRGGKKQYIPEVSFPQTKRLLVSLHQCYHHWTSLRIVAVAVELLLLELMRSKAAHSDRGSNIQPNHSTLEHQYCLLSGDKTSSEINFWGTLKKMIWFQLLNCEALEFFIYFFFLFVFWHWWMTIINGDRITEH